MDRKKKKTTDKPKYKKINTLNKQQDKSKQTKELAADSLELTFSLEEVLSLGGKKADYEELVSIDEEEELVTIDNEDLKDCNDLQKELQSLISKSGLSKIQNNNVLLNQKSEDDLSIKSQTEIVVALNDLSKLFEVFQHDNVICRNAVPWYRQITELPNRSSKLESEQIQCIHELAKKCWDKDVEIYQTARENAKSSDVNWLRTVLKSGTQSDKVSGLTVLAQESPIHSMRSLESLMGMAKKKARREALMAVDSLRHLWVTDLLPDFKLRSFSQYPIEEVKNLTKDGHKESQLQLLITMAFGHQLKIVYSDFVEVIQNLSKDPLVNIRNKVLGIIYELLSMKPEQEQKLLTMLINKLGDPDRKVASKTSYLLSQLIIKHPNMKGVIIQDVERMMFRPNVSEKAQYYAICFLNQIELSHQEKNVAAKLISIYFAFFKIIASKQKIKTDIDSQQTKLLSGLLTGVNRAYPYTGGEEENYDDQLDTLFRLTHVKHLSTNIQAFMLIYQVMESRQSLSDRYYQALYEKLLDPEIKNTSRHTLLLNLLYKSLKNDPVLKRTKAFMKRLLQVASPQQPSFLCGVVYMLSEIIKVKPGLKSMIDQAEEDEDDDEHFVDVVVPDDGTAHVLDEESEHENDRLDNKKQVDQKKKGASWSFVNHDNKNKVYVPGHRNPLYCGAENTCSWEILPLLSHFHPSVQHFTDSVVKGEKIEYKGDPLQDFTLMRFLDRFMYRNPKKTAAVHGSSIMQPTEHSQRLKEEPVNSKVFLQIPEEKIRQDELFFYRYFKQKETLEKKLHTGKIKEEQEKDVLDEIEEGNIYDIDFASDMRKSKDVKRKKKGSSEESDDESIEEDDGDMSDNESFDYNEMVDESEEEDFGNSSAGKQHFSDKDYEEALFQNLNSEGESDDEGIDQARARSGDSLDSMFAAADEFAHLLEKDENNEDGIHPKQKKWEERHQRTWKENPRTPHFKRKQNYHNKPKKRKKFEK